MAYHENSSEFIGEKSNYIGLDDASNIRPLYKNKIRNQCRLAGPTGQQSNGAVQDLSTDFLGYDWIASMVDNQIRPICTNISNRQVNVSANHYIDDEEWLNQREFFDKLNAFRQTNSDLCCSQRPLRISIPSHRLKNTKFLNDSFIIYKKHNPLSTSYPFKNTISLIGHCDYSVGTKRSQ
ncbi:unnamed protein product [Schistosoma mattheei]|uniref:Uncharacterized protein n=1 Tax=Schistosoma mattheei TaxID=31246 RepID=A0AA85B5P4_9TREM|nr:unnamed protein product [Schistosoma mattheei]